MAIVASTHGFRSLLQTDSDSRQHLKLASQAKLSGARSSGPASNPIDLTVASFSRVSHIGFEDNAAVTRVRGVRVTADDLDW